MQGVNRPITLRKPPIKGPQKRYRYVKGSSLAKAPTSHVYCSKIAGHSDSITWTTEQYRRTWNNLSGQRGATHL